MPEEKPRSEQAITSGDKSHNYQSTGDMHVHDQPAAPAAQSLIEKPTLELIRKYDREAAAIIAWARSPRWKRLVVVVLIIAITVASWIASKWPDEPLRRAMDALGIIP